MSHRSLMLRKLLVGYIALAGLLLGLCAWVIVEAEQAGVRSLVWLAVAAAATGAGVPAATLAYLWSRPVAEIIRAARQLSSGRLSDPVVISGSDELSELGEAINEMRDRLLDQIQTIDRQRRNLEMLVAGLEEGVVVADATGHIALSNPAARRMLGAAGPDSAETDSWKGRLMEVVIGQHDLQTMLLADGPAERRSVERTVELETGDGRRLTLHARAGDLPFEMPGAEPTVGRLLVLSDITELTRNMRMKTDFVANASHELRTPLNTLHMALENLQNMDRAAEAETADRFLTMALGHCARLEELLRDMLDLSRVESPVVRFRPEPLDAAGFFAELRQRYADRLAAKSLSWAFDCPGRVRLTANPHLMTLVFGNLVDNAIKFTPAGGRISVAVRPNGEKVEMAVADTGCGIPPADRDRVFERFYQVDRARSGPERGTGLGLSIVKHAVAALDGQVRLESELGKGTTITVTMPVRHGEN